MLSMNNRLEFRKHQRDLECCLQWVPIPRKVYFCQSPIEKPEAKGERAGESCAQEQGCCFAEGLRKSVTQGICLKAKKLSQRGGVQRLR